MTTPTTHHPESDWDSSEKEFQAAQARGVRKWLIGLAVIGLAMFGFAFLNSPLFPVLCGALGFQQNPNNELTTPTSAPGREVDVLFIGNTHGTLPVTLRPEKPMMKVRLGEQAIADYHFQNLSNTKVYFRPNHYVRPVEVSDQFNLSECFCFDDQMLHPKQSVSLPVVFTISPDIPDNVSQVTISYSLFQLSAEEYERSTQKGVLK